VRARHVGRATLAAVRRGEAVVFEADSAVARWSLHPDPASRTLRHLSPVAFWVPVVVVAGEPLIWADEAQDRHRLNAQYARSSTEALALGFVVSRATKRFVHRARPCTGAAPGDVFTHALADTLHKCPRGSAVSDYSSFFSEHAMALFAIASAATFQAQRQHAPNANTLAAAAFGGATVFSVGRIYQRHHWLSDVLVGAAVGTASGFLAAQLVPATTRQR